MNEGKRKRWQIPDLEEDDIDAGRNSRRFRRVRPGFVEVWTTPRSSPPKEKRASVPPLPAIFSYKPLDSANNEIRLISILPGDSTVECRLEHASLSSELSYTALSYCWGNPLNTKRIILNGCSIPVTVNLESAMVRLRNLVPGILIWIDALSINQEDRQERENQVLRMGDIYSNAKSVIAWLGGAYQPAPHVQMKVLKLLVSKEPRVYFNELLDQKSRRSQDLSAFYYAIIFDKFWQRAWILQEMLLAKTIQIVTGTISLPWEDLKAAVHHMRERIDSGTRGAQALENIQSLFDLREAFTKGRKIKLLQALNDTILQQATDPRDKVYGLLGVTCDGARLVPTPDYSLPLRSLLEDVTRRIALSEPSLDVLAGKSIWDRHELPQDWERPSWYPEWERLWNSRELGWSDVCYRSAQASATTYSDRSFEIEGNVVITHGVEVDFVNQLQMQIGGSIERECIGALPRGFKPMVYRSPQAIFTALSASLFGMKESFEDDWLCLAALFAADTTKLDQILGSRLTGLSSHWFIENKEFCVSGSSIGVWAQKAATDVDEGSGMKAPSLFDLKDPQVIEYITRLEEVYSWQWKVVITRRGCLGTIHSGAKLGDKICLLRAFRNIAVLRPWKDGHKIVGYAHIDGMMKGEMARHVELGSALKFTIY